MLQSKTEHKNVFADFRTDRKNVHLSNDRCDIFKEQHFSYLYISKIMNELWYIKRRIIKQGKKLKAINMHKFYSFLRIR